MKTNRSIIVDSDNLYSNEEMYMINDNLKAAGIKIDVYRYFDNKGGEHLCAIASIEHSVSYVIDAVGSAYIGNYK